MYDYLYNNISFLFMQVLTLELLNEEVLPILRQLELMHLLRFVHTQAQLPEKKENGRDLFRQKQPIIY